MLSENNKKGNIDYFLYNFTHKWQDHTKFVKKIKLQNKSREFRSWAKTNNDFSECMKICATKHAPHFREPRYPIQKNIKTKRRIVSSRNKSNVKASSFQYNKDIIMN